MPYFTLQYAFKRECVITKCVKYLPKAQRVLNFIQRIIFKNYFCARKMKLKRNLKKVKLLQIENAT